VFRERASSRRARGVSGLSRAAEGQEPAHPVLVRLARRLALPARRLALAESCKVIKMEVGAADLGALLGFIEAAFAMTPLSMQTDAAPAIGAHSAGMLLTPEEFDEITVPSLSQPRAVTAAATTRKSAANIATPAFGSAGSSTASFRKNVPGFSSADIIGGCARSSRAVGAKARVTGHFGSRGNVCARRGGQIGSKSRIKIKIMNMIKRRSKSKRRIGSASVPLPTASWHWRRGPAAEQYQSKAPLVSPERM
jgi:hypothetical protein